MTREFSLIHNLVHRLWINIHLCVNGELSSRLGEQLVTITL